LKKKQFELLKAQKSMFSAIRNSDPGKVYYELLANEKKFAKVMKIIRNKPCGWGAQPSLNRLENQ
jgi:hypothetical protein